MSSSGIPCGVPPNAGFCSTEVFLLTRGNGSRFKDEGTLLIVLAGIEQQVATFDRYLSKPKKIERVQVCHDGSLALQRMIA